MKSIFLFCLPALFLLSSGPVAGEAPAEGWMEGEISVAGRETLAGPLRYDAATDLLQLRTPGGVRVYSPRQAGGFRYFDAATNSIRRFVSLPQPGGRSRRAFYEVVLEGEFQLLRRLRPQAAPRMQTALAHTDSPWYDGGQAYSYQVYAGGRFVPETRFYREVYPRMLAEFPDALRQYMAQKRLNLFTQRGRFLLLHKYNLLRGSETLSALRP